MSDDIELLRRYAEEGAEEAFRELVARHVDLVYAAARRTLGDLHLAQDVAQTVFSDLARKAPEIPRERCWRGGCISRRGMRRRRWCAARNADGDGKPWPWRMK